MAEVSKTTTKCKWCDDTGIIRCLMTGYELAYCGCAAGAHCSGLTSAELGIVHRSIGAEPDTEYMDDDETAEYLRGYNHA